LKEIALLLERRSASWIPSLRDPAFLGFLAACLLFLAIAWWLLSQSSRSLEGEQKLKSLLENATQAEATEYEPVSTSLDQIDDWLALQGLDDFWLPNSLLDSKALAVRTFPFEGSRVAAVLLPEQQMILCFFDPTPLDISFPNENVWNYFQSGNNTAAVAIRGRLCILAAIRGTRAQLQNILQPDKPNS
ncbi:MAG: hypothetical protein NZL93_01835, partial [Chthoniobacterales bacterium]|nr:hypothetical protein [Chthoniobacterales bacterium]